MDFTLLDARRRKDAAKGVHFRVAEWHGDVA